MIKLLHGTGFSLKTDTELLKKFTALTEQEIWSLCLQEPINAPYSEPVESSPRFQTLFL
jgi:hypothetical protein